MTKSFMDDVREMRIDANSGKRLSIIRTDSVKKMAERLIAIDDIIKEQEKEAEELNHRDNYINGYMQALYDIRQILEGEVK